MHFQSKKTTTLFFNVLCFFPVILLCSFLVPSVLCENNNNHNDHSSGYPHTQKREKRDFFGHLPPEFRLGNSPTIDPDAVYNGIMDPNNIAIHVGQNFVNFAAGTLAWFVLSFFFDERTRRSFPESPIPISIRAPYDHDSVTYLYKRRRDGRDYGVEEEEFTPGTRRVSRSTGSTSDDHGNTSTKMTKMLSGKRIANMLRSFADTAESFDRYILITIFSQWENTPRIINAYKHVMT